MDDPRQPNKKKNQPTWTERAVPETVRPGQTRPLTPEEADALVPAADPIVKAAYGRTGALPVRPVMNRGDGATDALVIQRGAKQTRVLNFEVEGVHWRAGFAPEAAATPLSQYLTSPVPPDRELRTGNGFLMRPVEPELEAVLRDLVPAKLLAVGEEMYGRARELGGLYLYYIPQPRGATIGIVAWYLASPMAKSHLLYLQTDIKKAEVRVVDDMHKTFRASLIARQQQGPTAPSFDFWHELQLASAQVEATLKNSSLARNSADVKGRVRAARDQAENRLYQGLDSGLGSLSGLAKLFLIQLPQLALANLIRGCSQVLIAAIRWADRVAGGRNKNDGLY